MATRLNTRFIENEAVTTDKIADGAVNSDKVDSSIALSSDLSTLSGDVANKVDKSTTVNGHALSSNVTVSKSDVGLGNVTNDAQLKAADLDTDNTLAANSDSKVPSQKAVKSYTDTGLSGKADKTITVNGQALSSNVSLSKSDVGLGNVTDDAQLKAADLDTDATLAANSDSKIASQKAVKSFVASSISAIPPTDLSGKVDKTTTVNGHALSSNVTVSKSDVGLGNVDDVQQLPMSYLDTSSTLSNNSDSKVASQKAIKAYVDNGLSGKLDSSEKGAASGLATLDSNQLIPIGQIPPAALERLVIVANQAARFALTTAQAQNGDTVKQTDTGEMFFVKDDSKLDQSGGYEVYTAGAASSVAWGGVTSTPTTLSGYGITDAVPSSRTVNGKALSSNISLDKTDVSLGNVDNVQQMPLSYLDTDNTLAANSDTKVPSQKAIKAYVGSSISAIPAPDLSSKVDKTTTVNGYALSSNVTLGKSDIGLGSVDNVQQLPMSYLDTDNTLAANSDTKVPSQKAIKAYVASQSSSAASGVIEDQIVDGVTTKAPSQNAVFDALAGKQDKVSGDVAPGSFSLSNNQSSASNVTGLAFANGSIRSAQVQYAISIDADSDLFEEGTIELLQKGSGWNIVRHAMGDDTGVEFSVTSGGQIQYTSSDVTGFVSGVIKFRAQSLAL